MQANNIIDPSDNINIFRNLVPERTTFALQKVDTTEGEHILYNLKNKKCPGYDNITPKMLLIRKNSVVNTLTDIFNKMVEEGSYSNILKIHKIIPNPKIIGSKVLVLRRQLLVLLILFVQS